MRTIVLLCSVVVLAALFYVAWPFWALYQIADAVHDRDPQAFVERVDLTSLRRSIIRQVLDEGSRNSEIEERLGEIGRQVAVSVGVSAIDPRAAALLTPELLKELIATGSLPESDAAPAAEGGMELGLPENPLRYIKGWSVRTPSRVRIRVGETERAEDWAALMLVLQGAEWKLTEIVLPESVLAQVAPYLRKRIEQATL